MPGQKVEGGAAQEEMGMVKSGQHEIPPGRNILIGILKGNASVRVKAGGKLEVGILKEYAKVIVEKGGTFVCNLNKASGESVVYE